MFLLARILLSLPLAHAHIAAFAKGMYCKDGLPGQNNQNNNLPIGPLYQLSKQDWWFQHDRGCDQAPPPPSEFLEIPSGGHFTVEHADNQAFTTLSYGGSQTSKWPDGAQHPENWHGHWENGECMPGGGFMHTTNQSDAQGTAFAIAYESDLSKITVEELVVFSVLPRTPWHREATYAVPSGMPECPEGGCTCAFLWVPKNCGQQNMYMQGLKCKVTGAVGNKKITKAKAPLWCADDEGQCRKGAKQMVVFNQAEGNNVEYPEYETPAYNEVLGFMPGAQEDIFDDASELISERVSVFIPASSSTVSAISSFLTATIKTTARSDTAPNHGRKTVYVTVIVTENPNPSPDA